MASLWMSCHQSWWWPCCQKPARQEQPSFLTLGPGKPPAPFCSSQGPQIACCMGIQVCALPRCGLVPRHRWFSTAVEHCSSAWQLLYANVASRAGQGVVRHCSIQCHAGLPSSRVSIIAASFGQLCMSCGEECPHLWPPRVTLLYEE